MRDLSYTGSLTPNRAEVWQDSAACRGEPYQLFDYQDGTTPLTEGMNYDERFEFNTSNLSVGVDICMNCPVFVECGKDATDEDTRWTVRAGLLPAAFIAEDEKHRQALYDAQYCKRGHRKEVARRCKQCETMARKKAEANGAKAPTGQANGV